MTTPETTLPQTVAILGANGRLSREVARAFHSAGWQVRAITRNGKSEAFADCTGMEFAAADAMKRDELIAATAGCDVIFNGLNPLYTDWAEKAVPMMRNALAAAKEAEAVHLFAGNIYNFGSQMPADLLPDTPMRPDHRKARIRVEMEELAKQAASDGDVKTIVLRAGDFFGGDGTGSWFDQMLAAKVSKGKFTYPGNRNIVHAWAYLPDLAKAFVGLAENAANLSDFETFHFEGHNITGAQMHEAAEAAVGHALRKGSLPGFLPKLAGIFSPMMREISEVYYQWYTPHAMRDDRLEKVIGALPKTPLVKAVGDAFEAQGIEANNERVAAVPHELTTAK